MWSLGVAIRDSTHVSDVLLPFYVVAIGKVGAKVAASTFLAAQRRARDQQARGDDVPQAPEFAVRDARLRRRPDHGVPFLEACDGCFHPAPFAEQTAVPPHQRADIVG